MDGHGGNVYQAEAEWGCQRENLLDFSANINPLGTPESLKGYLRERLERLGDYPDPDQRKLRAGIARYLQTPEAGIIAGNGAAEIIYLVFRVLRPRRVLIVAPTFSEYQPAAMAAGAAVTYFTLDPADGFQVDLARLSAALNGMDCLMLCNPNNPTATLLPLAQLRQLAVLTQAAGAAFVVDEAFIELTVGGNANSLVPLLDEFPQLFLIRAFTKIFAIPGLRVGYGLGRPELIAALRRAQLPWSVNLLADAVADFLPRAEGYLQQTQDWLRSEPKWLAQSLRTLPGLRVFEPWTNFILVELWAGMTVAVLQQRLAARGILIRAAANFQGLNERFFRVAVRDRASNRILLRRLAEILGATGAVEAEGARFRCGD